MDKSIEVAFILIPDIVGEASRTFAIGDHQLCESGRFANRLSVTGNGLFGLCDRDILVAQHIWPEPAVQGFLVGLQNIFAQAEAGVKEGLIILVGSIKILNQAL